MRDFETRPPRIRRPKYAHVPRVVQWPTRSPAVEAMNDRFPTSRPGCHCRGQPQEPVCYKPHTGTEGSVTLSSACFAACVGMTPEDYTEGACQTDGDVPETDDKADDKDELGGEPTDDLDDVEYETMPEISTTAPPAAAVRIPPPTTAPPTLPPFVPTTAPPGIAEKPARDFRIEALPPVHSLVFEHVPPFFVPGDHYLVRGGYAAEPRGVPTVAWDSWGPFDHPWTRYGDQQDEAFAPPALYADLPAHDTTTVFRELTDF